MPCMCIWPRACGGGCIGSGTAAPCSTAVMMSLGRSMCTGPRLPEEATRKASCMTERTCSQQ